MSYDNIYGSINHMLENLNNLLEEVKLDPIDHDLLVPGGIVLIVESLVNSGMASKNIDEISKQLERALSAYKIPASERWITEPEARMYGVSDNTRERPGKPDEKANRQFDPLFDFEDNHLNMNDDNLLLDPTGNIDVGKNPQSAAGSNADSKLKEAATAETDDAAVKDAAVKDVAAGLGEASEKAFLKMVNDLISLRDNLFIKQGSAAQDGSVNSVEVLKVISSTIRETANLLKQNNIEIIDRSGMFDETCQSIINSRSTDDKTLDNTVAETFRQGYKYNGKIIRPQEVILYTYSDVRI